MLSPCKCIYTYCTIVPMTDCGSCQNFSNTNPIGDSISLKISLIFYFSLSSVIDLRIRMMVMMSITIHPIVVSLILKMAGHPPVVQVLLPEPVLLPGEVWISVHPQT